jgi:hypothetical protein
MPLPARVEFCVPSKALAVPLGGGLFSWPAGGAALGASTGASGTGRQSLRSTSCPVEAPTAGVFSSVQRDSAVPCTSAIGAATRSVQRSLCVTRPPRWTLRSRASGTQHHYIPLGSTSVAPSPGTPLLANLRVPGGRLSCSLVATVVAPQAATPNCPLQVDFGGRHQPSI